MKPPLFHVGQAVVCATESFWTTEMHKHVPDIKKDKVLHIAGMEWMGPWGRPYWYLWFEEIPYPNAYREDKFRAVELLPDAALAELLEETLAPVTA
jgi:hypothetical protein